MKRFVGVVDSTHSLRGLCLVDGIISPPIRMPLLHKTLVLLFQLAGACPGPEADGRVRAGDRID